MKRKSYIEQVHIFGRIWILSALAMLILVPVAICVRYDAWPDFGPLMKGMLTIVPVYWLVGAIEVITFVPMLGVGGSYLGFVTGNLSNLKVPCALNAMETAKVKPGTEEGDIISTIAIAVSSIVTTAMIALGVLLLAQIQPILESPILQPAFKLINIMAALFGALGVAYISKNWKIAVAPMAVMLAAFLIAPFLAEYVSILVPVGALIAIGVARILYNKGLLNEKTDKGSK